MNFQEYAMDKLDYLIASLDFHLARGLAPAEAWTAAVEDYAQVYHTQDERTLLQRAAEVALQRMDEDKPKFGKFKRG